jgi:acyl CoA:acetate/3-ketoacid CoA transferase beta subunit
MMAQTGRDGAPKILERCTLPLTATRCVNKIYTDVAVMRIEAGTIVVEEHAPGWTLDEIQAITATRLVADGGMKEVSFG